MHFQLNYIFRGFVIQCLISLGSQTNENVNCLNLKRDKQADNVTFMNLILSDTQMGLHDSKTKTKHPGHSLHVKWGESNRNKKR